MRRAIEAPGGRVFYSLEGGEAAPALLLLHAWPLDGRLWSAAARRLSTRYRVLRPDWRGCAPEDGCEHGSAPFQGRSRPEDWPPVTPADLAMDVAAILTAEAIDSVIAAGCSLGGYVLYELLRQFPERIRAAAICDARPEADADHGEARRQADAELLAEAGRAGAEPARANWRERLLPRLLGETTRARRPEVASRLAGWLAERSIAAAVRLNQGMARRRDQRPLLPTLRLPVTILAGEEDALWPAAEVRQTAAATPGAELQFIPQAGHLPMLENPAAFDPALDEFLQTVTN